jgi:spore coat protein U-like protein
MRTRIYIAASILMLMTAIAVNGTTEAARFEVSATVNADCRISVTDLFFGSYDPLGQNGSRELDAAAGVNMLCTRDARAKIAIDSGRNAADGTRGLAADGQRVSYQIYRDADRTQVWGSGADAQQFVSTGIQSPQQFNVYARIPPGQEVASGRYTDVVTATVEF